MRNPLHTYLALACGTAMVAMLALLVDIGDDELAQQQRLYCDMVAFYADSDGKYGWPDYKHIAGRVCK